MTVEKILRHPHPALSQRTPSADMSEADLRAVAEDVVHAMYAEKVHHLSAPLLGVAVRLIAVHVTKGVPPLVVVDPTYLVKRDDGEYVEPSDEVTSAFMPVEWWEKCPAFLVDGNRHPLKVGVIRPKGILLRGKNVDGSPFERRLYDGLARGALHEIDHLDGITVRDRAGKMKKKLIDDCCRARAK